MANVFETEIAKSFRNYGDKQTVDGIEYSCCIYTKLVVNKQGGYGIKTPCDSLVDTPFKISLALELKETKGTETLFPFARVPVHQEEGLIHFEMCERKSFVLLRFGKPKLSAFAIPINLYLSTKKTINRKSLPYTWLQENAISLPRITGGWDITPLLKH